jgi:hypothetical protein
MLTSLANTLEVGLNLAFELQSIATRASGKWILDNIAAQLEARVISPLFKKLQRRGLVIESHSIPSSRGSVTHLLLPTLIASSLHARLSSSLSLVFIILSARPRTALELGTAPLPLVASSSPWADACGWAHSPTTRGSLTPFHAGTWESAAKIAFDSEA